MIYIRIKYKIDMEYLYSFLFKNKMITIASTRFNNDTWNENMDYRRTNELQGCIYGTPNPMSELIPLNTNVIICEMNNSCDKIMGLGLIKNYLYTNKQYQIYSKGNYNRFTYLSDYRVDREDILEDEKKIIEDLEKIVFKGKDHIKRGFGITSIPQKKMSKLNYNIKEKVWELFSTRFHFLN